MTDTLAEAQADLRKRLLAGEAVPCPCCTQLCKVYKRSIHAAMARSLILMHRHTATRDADGYVYLPEVLRGVRARGGDEAKLTYWGLIEQAPGQRPDGSKRNGWWRLTNLGRSYVHGHMSLPKYAHVYDGRVLQFSGRPVTIRECLGDKFDYSELMSQ